MTTRSISPLRQRMIEDMNARQLGPPTQRSHIYSCARLAAFLKRPPDTATTDDVRRFQLHLMASGASIGNRNRIMTGVKFLLRVTLSAAQAEHRPRQGAARRARVGNGARRQPTIARHARPAAGA